MDEALRRPVGELLALPPTEFVAARNALAKDLRGHGRRELAGLVAGLRRPAWTDVVLNRTAVDAPEVVAAFCDAAAAARDAQAAAVAGAVGSGLAEAVRRLRDTQQTLVSAADRALRAAGRPSDPGGLSERIASIAVRSDDCAQLRHGLLGFHVAGDVDDLGDLDDLDDVEAGRAAARATSRRPRPVASDERSGGPERAGLRAARTAAEAAFRVAVRAATVAERDADRTRQRAEKAQRAADEADADLAAARAAAELAHRDLAAAADAAALADGVADDARSRLVDLRAALDAAEAALAG